MGEDAEAVGDTETLLALISSLLSPGYAPSAEVIIEALVESSGDAAAAARLLNVRRDTEQQSTHKGRKRKFGKLDNWLIKSDSSERSGSAKRKEATRTKSESAASGTLAELQQAKRVSSDSNHLMPSKIGSPSKPVIDLMSVLRQPPSPPKILPRLLPLTLPNAALIAKHTPCTLHTSVLPKELAGKLFYSMLDQSRSWKRNKWWLFDRVVESPHRTSFYARKTDGINTDETWQEAAQYWYNGRKTDVPAMFSQEMEQACTLVEQIVNEEMKKRKRFRLEWDSGNTETATWRANVAASNCYEGSKESVGPHSDHLTYLGPYPTIASLSLGTGRNFSLREVIPSDQTNVRNARTVNIPLPHNSLLIMHASCQERFKHSVPPQQSIDLYHPTFPRNPGESVEPSNCRINITFRFYRPDFRPPSIPRCKCDIPSILRPDMKNLSKGETDRYWWTCHAGAQNEGKGCSFWKVLDMEEERRGPWFGIPSN